jgi:hypothetical protein
MLFCQSLWWWWWFTYLHTYGAEPFLKSHQFYSYSRISQHFMEPEGSLACSQEHSTGPYPEPAQSTPSYLSMIHFNIVHPPTPWSSHWSFSFQYPTRIPRLPCPPHPPWLDHSNYTWRRVQGISWTAWLKHKDPGHTPSRGRDSNTAYPE